MTFPPPPDARGLASFLAGLEPLATGAPLRVEARENLDFGTHPKEIVTCALSGGRTVRLLCKYGVSEPLHRAHGHRGGIPVERWMYERVLEPMELPAPRRYRASRPNRETPPWLVLEYLQGSQPVDLPGDSALMAEAARIAARLHALTEAADFPATLEGTPPSYDRDYFQGWANRAVRFLGTAAGAESDLAWITRLRDGSEAWIDPLLSAASVVIHGEYYPRNVLEWNGKVMVVDWESAAFAAGEIDLAALTEGWSADEARPWEEAYRRERWPEGSAAGHGEALPAARIYLQLRWLGDRREWTSVEVGGRRLATLRALAEAAGIL